MLLSPGTTGSSVSVAVADGSVFNVEGTRLTSAIQTTTVGGATVGANSMFKFADSSATVQGNTVDALFLRASFGNYGVISVLRSNFTTVESVAQTNRAFHLEALGDHCSFLLSHSIINATGHSIEALKFAASVSYGNNMSLSVVASNITGTDRNAGPSALTINGPTLDEQFTLSVADSTFVTTSYFADGKALALENVQIGPNASIKVTDTTFNVTGANAFVTILQSVTFSGRPTFDFLRSNLLGTQVSPNSGYAPPVSFLSITLSNEGLALTIDSSRFYSWGAFGCTFLLLGTFPAFNINIASSTVEVMATEPTDPPTGVVVFQSSAVWNGGGLSVSDSSLTFLEGTTAASGVRFVHWPDTITGFTPQTFESVTLSAPVGVLTAPFVANAGGAYSGNTTFCANNVKWANGTAVVAGPPEFTAVTTCQVSHTVAPTPSLATMSPRASKSLSLSSPPSPTLTAPRTASAAPSMTLSAPKTQSGQSDGASVDDGLDVRHHVGEHDAVLHGVAGGGAPLVADGRRPDVDGGDGGERRHGAEPEGTQEGLLC